LEGWKLELVPEEPAIEGIAKQVRSRAKAYPLFELARLILQLSDRYSVKLTPESDQGPPVFSGSNGTAPSGPPARRP
jgi:hypothetical protein